MYRRGVSGKEKGIVLTLQWEHWVEPKAAPVGKAEGSASMGRSEWLLSHRWKGIAKRKVPALTPVLLKPPGVHLSLFSLSQRRTNYYFICSLTLFRLFQPALSSPGEDSLQGCLLADGTKRLHQSSSYTVLQCYLCRLCILRKAHKPS